mgnify:CR=1 FL=1|jgi:hypothetical protein
MAIKGLLGLLLQVGAGRKVQLKVEGKLYKDGMSLDIPGVILR